MPRPYEDKAEKLVSLTCSFRALGVPLTVDSANAMPTVSATESEPPTNGVVVNGRLVVSEFLVLGKSLHGMIQRISPEALQAIKSASLEGLQHEIERSKVQVDRNSNYPNLLDFIYKWFNYVLLNGNRDAGTFVQSPAAIARMGLWLVSEGLVATAQYVANHEPDWPHLAQVPKEEVPIVRFFLAKVNEGLSPPSRILRAISFAIWHDGKLSTTDSLTINLGHIHPTEHLGGIVLTVLARLENEFWSKENVIDSGIERVITTALLRYEMGRRSHGFPLEKDDLDNNLQGPRTVLLKLLRQSLANMKARSVLSKFIGLCHPLPLLTDEFGDIVAIFALRHGLLDFWCATVEEHRMTSTYLHTPGLQNGFSDAIIDWGRVTESVRIEGEKFYKIHWRSVGKNDLRDFEEILRPYVRVQSSDDLYEECKVFHELDV